MEYATAAAIAPDTRPEERAEGPADQTMVASAAAMATETRNTLRE